MGDHPDLRDPDWQRHAEKEAWIDLRRSRRRSRRGRRLAISAVVLVVVAGGAFGLYRWGKSTTEQYSGGPANAPGLRVTTTNTAPAPTDLPTWGAVEMSRPFADTPAQNWAEGVAGLTTPPPGKVGAQQTAAALDSVKQLITAAALDHDTLEAHHADHYLALLAPDARADIRPVVNGPDKVAASSHVTFLADGYHLLPAAPRMTGNLTMHPGKPGELVVHASYVIAYAFDPGSQPVSGPADIEPFQRVEADYVLRTGSTFAKSSTGLWPGASSFSQYAMGCAAAKAGFLAPAFSDRQYGVAAASVEPGAFDPDQPMPTQNDC